MVSTQHAQKFTIATQRPDERKLFLSRRAMN